MCIRDSRKSLLLFVHERLQTADLTVQQQRMARGKLRSLIEQLAATADPQVQALADVYAVSYTHLDVYKRQMLRCSTLRSNLMQRIWCLAPMAIRGCARRSWAV